MLTAAAIMTENIATIRPESSIHEAIELMLSQHISGLPVIDRSERLVGVITEFALLAIAYDQEIQSQTVAEHMTTDVFTVDADEPISRVADLCIVHRVRRVPVMRDSRLVGLITRRDVLKALYEVQAPTCTA